MLAWLGAVFSKILIAMNARPTFAQVPLFHIFMIRSEDTPPFVALSDDAFGLILPLAFPLVAFP